MGVVIPFTPRIRKNGSNDEIKNFNSSRYYRIVIKDHHHPEGGNRIAIQIEIIKEISSEKDSEFFNILEERLRDALPDDSGVEFPERTREFAFLTFLVFGERLTRIIETLVPVLRQAGLTAQNTEVVSCFHGSILTE